MELKLKRALKFNRLVAITMGTPLASSVFLSILLMVFTAGDLINLILSIIVATVIVILASFAYGQLVSIYPSAAGNRIFLKKAMGNQAAIAFSIMWIFILLAAAGVEAYIVGYVFNYFVPVIPAYFWSVIVLAAVVLVNLVGVEISGNFQVAVTYIVAVSLAVISIIAILSPGAHNSITAGSLDLGAVFTSAAVGVYFFLGFARVSTLGEEAVDYERSIPRAMPIGVFMLGVVFLLVSIAIFRNVPYADLQNTVVPQILLGKYMIPGGNYAYVVAIVSILMSFTAFNAGLLGTSRLVYAMGREGVLPSFLGRIESRHFTPYLSLIFLFAVVWIFVSLVYVTNNFEVPIYIAAGFDSFMYGFTAYSAFWHTRHMDPSGIPFDIRWGKVIFPVTALVFILIGFLLLLSVTYWVALLMAVSLVLIFAYVRVKNFAGSGTGTDSPEP